MSEEMNWVEPAADGSTIKVYVTPRASANKVLGVHSGELKIALTAPPVEGAANKALLELLARALDVPKSSVSLLSGESSRHKVVQVRGVTPREVLRVLTAS